MVSQGVEVIRWTALTPSPWKNGGGVTRVVASSPTGSSTQDFDWRVSIADVAAPGPFSTFPGVERVITLIQGGSMVLDSDAGQSVLTAHAPHRFAGEAAVTCRLPDGPTRNLNLMTRRARTSGDVSVHAVSSSLPVGGDARRQLVVALADGVTAADQSGGTWGLDLCDVLVTAGPVMVGPGTIAVISIG